MYMLFLMMIVFKIYIFQSLESSLNNYPLNFLNDYNHSLSPDQPIIYNNKTLKNGNTTYASCKVSKTKTFWGCKLSYVFFGDISYNEENIYYKNADYSYFQSGIQEIISPIAFMNYLNKTVFYPYINDGKCTYENYMYQTYFKCNCDIVDQLPKINFVFDSYAYSVPMDKLFQAQDESCSFLIKNYLYDDDHWIFGKKFLQNYDSSFDFKDKSVSFWSETNNIEYVDIEKLFPFKKALRIGSYFIAILVIGLAILSISLIYSKKTNNS